MSKIDEKKFWKHAEAPVRLIDVLSAQTKAELDAIRFSGHSGWPKAICDAS
ncbi:hypothetical protein [Mesobacillus thioparans]|uniref:hypothetical protein n=1 Tax=Mesobacillus thioparans TaxID=370439 RepID=UPI0039F07572